MATATYLTPPKSLSFNMHWFQKSLFYGYITGTTLTITDFDATDIEGVGIGFTIAGQGVASNTYVINVIDPALRTFTLSVSQNVGSVGSPATFTAIPTSLQS